MLTPSATTPWTSPSAVRTTADLVDSSRSTQPPLGGVPVDRIAVRSTSTPALGVPSDGTMFCLTG